MAGLDLVRNRNGELILPGRVRKVTTWPFMTDTSLPSTLTTSGTGASGTVTVNNQSAGTGDLVISSTNSNKVTILGPTLAAGSFESIYWELEGVWSADTNVASMGISINSGSNGFYYDIINGTFKSRGGADILTASNPYLVNLQGKRNMGILWNVRNNHAYLTMGGDAEYADFDLSGNAGSDVAAAVIIGAVQPTIFYTATASQTSVLHIEQLRLTTTSF